MKLAKRSKIWVVVIFLLSLLLAIFFERCYSALRLFKSAYYELIDQQNQQLTLKDFSVLGYESQGNKLSVTSGQPNQLSYGEINRSVGTITVYFAQPLQQDIASSLYYTRDSLDFNENMRIRVVSQQGDLSLTFRVNSPVQKVRLDIGEQEGNQFILSQVCINEPWHSIRELIKDAFKPMALSRSSLFFVVLMFIGFHFLFDIKRMYKVLFRYRYAAAAGLLLFVALQQYHGSSIGMYDNLVQPGWGSEFTSPVFGKIRAIRGDEWAVSTPWKLATAYGDNAFGEYNYIMRATQTVNLGTGGLYLGYAALGNLPSFFIYIFGIKGFGAYWFSLLIFCFMVSFEMCRILCKDNKLFSLVGAFLITFSAYFQWWSYVTWIIYGQAILVCCYYFFKSNKLWKDILLAIGIGLSGASFICIFYPAWLIPAGYLFIFIFIWVLADNWKAVKKLGWKKWTAFALGILFGLSIVWAYLDANNEYVQAISNTVYPGARVSQGGLSLDSIFKYIISPLFPYLEYGNPSEAGKFFSLYPVAMVMGLYIWFKSQKKDLLLTLLLGYSIFLTLYTTAGIPMVISKITLMSYSTEQRALNILDFIQIYLLLMVMTRYKDFPKMKSWVGIGLSVCLTSTAILFADAAQQDYMPLWYVLAAFVIIVALSYGVFCKISAIMEKTMCYLLIGISLVTGLTVNPIQKGFDTIYSKPVAKEIMTIVEEDNVGKWIVVDQRWLPGFLIACGAPTINSVNNYPNMELWGKIDSEHKYNEVYNRFAHMEIALTEQNSFPELVNLDAMKLNLSYSDLEEIGVKYIFVQHPLESKLGVGFDLMYNEAGCYIYKVNYS